MTERSPWWPVRKNVPRVVLGVVIGLYCILVLFPLLIIIVPTFQTVQESSQGILTLPHQLSFINYADAWRQSRFPRALLNSLIVTGSTIALNILLAATASFPIALRERKTFFRVCFFVFIIGLMLPFQAVMIPLYHLMGRRLKLTNTYPGPILTYIAMTLPLSIFFFTQFIRTIPSEMEEASVIDGCSHFRMLWRIYFPLLRPITATIVIQSMIFVWNDLLVPLLLIDKDQLKPIMPMVYVFFGTYYNKWNLAFSVLVLGALPLLVLFLALQKQFVKGMAAGAVKG